MKTPQLDFLLNLLKTHAPTGQEVPAQKVWMNYVKSFADEVGSDAYGNCFAVINPKAPVKILIDGHADEIGFTVNYISKDGFIYFLPVGGQDPIIAPGQRVYIHTKKGKVNGVIGCLAIHLRDKSIEQKVPKFEDLFIDIGVSSEKDALKVIEIGDLITFIADPINLTDKIIASRACDNRIGIFSSAEVLRLCSLNKKKLNVGIIATSTIQEEIGCLGAAMVGYSLFPTASVAVDVYHATDIPYCNHKKQGNLKLGKGPIISRGTVHHPTLFEGIKGLAEKKKIPYQIHAEYHQPGNSAREIFKQRGGIPSITVSLPNRYMHSPNEVIHLDDLDNLTKLLAEYFMSLPKNAAFKTAIK
jgi:endoglucanase